MIKCTDIQRWISFAESSVPRVWRGLFSGKTADRQCHYGSPFGKRRQFGPRSKLTPANLKPPRKATLMEWWVKIVVSNNEIAYRQTGKSAQGFVAPMHFYTWCVCLFDKHFMKKILIGPFPNISRVAGVWTTSSNTSTGKSVPFYSLHSFSVFFPKTKKHDDFDNAR